MADFKYKVLTEEDGKKIEQNICPVCGEQSVTNDSPFKVTIDENSYAMTEYDCLTCKANFAYVEGRVDKDGNPIDVLCDDLIYKYLKIN